MKRNTAATTMPRALVLAAILTAAPAAWSDFDLRAYRVGRGPEAIAFDGANLWVANQFDNSLTKLGVVDGRALQTMQVGRRPVAMAFDGTNLWVANLFSNNVMMVRPEDATVVGTSAVGRGPGGLAVDGGTIWVANRESNDVTKLRASDGATAACGSPIRAATPSPACVRRTARVSAPSRSATVRSASPLTMPACGSRTSSGTA
jgi:hypothetical protein